jgi:hypothetical protein
LQFLSDARLGDHAAVPDQHHAAQTKALPQLGDLGRERLRVGGIAGKHLDRNRAAVARTQGAKDDLQFVGFAVAVVAKARQRAAAAFQIGRGDVVQDQGAVAEMPAGQLGLNLGLLPQQPVEGVVEFVDRHCPQAQYRAQRVARGRRVEAAGGGQLGGRIDQPDDD